MRATPSPSSARFDEAAKTGRSVQVKQGCGRDAPSRSSVCDCSPVFVRLLHGPTVSPSAAASVR
jgi:hypothetical protein